ncbi:MAG: asparagine synthetase B [Methanosaeta sp. PtaB.Bin018]|nr:MAG: asparagine synthetase B [Methanosaeta sp. PtaB.Bin018]
MPSARVKGWVELDAIRLTQRQVEAVLSGDLSRASRFGGEFLIEWNGCLARDHFGIMAGDCPPGTVLCNGKVVEKVDPAYPVMDLGKAIEIAVGLRSDEGVVALSGGVDSALVAKLARLECVVVGASGSHDISRAKQVARELCLPLEQVLIDSGMIEDSMRNVLPVIPKIDPVNVSIATTLYFVAEWAEAHGHQRILAGQGADELFGGYARYLQTENLAEDLERDFQGLALQLARDQAVAALHGAYFSLPYMDVRVVRAARSIPPEMKVYDNIRKRPLRDVAEKYLPASVARYEKKAMQYGSGMMKEIQRLAKRRGYGKSVQSYVEKIAQEEGRNVRGA